MLYLVMKSRNFQVYVNTANILFSVGLYAYSCFLFPLFCGRKLSPIANHGRKNVMYIQVYVTLYSKIFFS
jgi:hypothetical protein